ncbi:hypothetical protein Ancab_002811, partial [Ancistrocladus abbreviatus]
DRYVIHLYCQPSPFHLKLVEKHKFGVTFAEGCWKILAGNARKASAVRFEQMNHDDVLETEESALVVPKIMKRDWTRDDNSDRSHFGDESQLQNQSEVNKADGYDENPTQKRPEEGGTPAFAVVENVDDHDGFKQRSNINYCEAVDLDFDVQLNYRITMKGNILKQINFTSTLIRKVANASEVTDFRPVGCLRRVTKTRNHLSLECTPSVWVAVEIIGENEDSRMNSAMDPVASLDCKNCYGKQSYEQLQEGSSCGCVISFGRKRNRQLHREGSRTVETMICQIIDYVHLRTPRPFRSHQ